MLRRHGLSQWQLSEATNRSDTMTNLYRLTTVAALVLAAGCDVFTPGEDELSFVRQLNLHLDAPSEVNAGDSVAITMNIENISNRPAEIVFGTGPNHVDGNLRIEHDEGGVVRNTAFFDRLMLLVPRESGRTTLESGETRKFDFTWTQIGPGGTPVDPGTYMVTGELISYSLGFYSDEHAIELRSAPHTIHIR